MSAKVLFVDDDVNILAAFKRQLSGEFDVDTAPGAEQALVAISSRGPYSVIVADMRMPGMDGIQLLTRVREITPNSVRIMLTGHADTQTAIEAINQGSIFKFLTKPCSPDILLRTLREAVEEYDENMTKEEILERGLSQGAATKRKILIVDSDMNMVRDLYARLKVDGFDVLFATDGLEVMKLAREQKPDLIILELVLPAANGYVVMDRLRSIPSLAFVPVIVMTGADPSVNKNRAIAAGASCFLEKPVNYDLLLQAISNAVGESKPRVVRSRS